MVQLKQRFVTESAVVSLSLAVLLILLTCFYWPWLTNQASFYVFDFTYGWHANISYAAHQIASGRLPLWNPYLVCGVPQLTIAASTPFYPPLYLFACLPFDQSMALLLSGQQLLSAIGVFLLACSFGAALVSALLGACAYGLGGLMFSAQVAYTYQATAAVIPWCIWAFKGIDTGDRPSALSYTAIAAVLVAAMLSPSVIELAFVTLCFLFLYTIADVARPGQRRPLRTLVLRLSALALGVGLATPIIFPLLQWLPLSERASGVPGAEMLSWSGTWYDFALLLLPHPLGDLYNNSNPFMLMPGILSPPWLGTAYLGPVLVTFSLCGFLNLPRKRQVWCALAFMLLALCILGKHTAAGGLLVQLHAPVRYPIKLIYFFVALLIALSVKGCSDWLKGAGGSVAWGAFALWLCILTAGVMLSSAACAAQLAKLLAPDSLKLGAQAARACAPDMIVAGLVGLLTTVIIIMTKRHQESHRQAFSYLLLVTAATMYVVDAYNYGRHAGPADFFTRAAPLAGEIQSTAAPQSSNGSYVRFASMYKDPARVVHGQQLVDWTVSNYEHVRQMLVSPNNLPFRLGSVVAFSPGTSGPLYACMQHALSQWRAYGNAAPFERYCRMTACNAAVTERETVSFNRVLAPVPLLDPHSFRLRAQNEVQNYRVYTPNEVTPRAFFAPKVAWGKPHASVVELVTYAYERGFDPGRLTILEHVRPDEIGPRITVNPTQLASASVRFIRDDPETVELEVQTPVENFLVLLDQNYPGWQAFLDGHRKAIYPANAAFRAVLVPQGQHRIVFTFNPF